MDSAAASTLTRSHTKVYLLEEYVEEIKGGKLPSLKQVLGRFLYLHVEGKKTLREASAMVVEEVTEFWNKAHIPMKDFQNCQNKVEKTFEKWRLLKKNKGRKSSTQQANESAFVKTFEDLFDLAHENALSLITIAEDREFLLAQRETGRRGYMASWDKKLYDKEHRSIKRHDALIARQQRQLVEQSRLKENKVENRSLSSSSSEEELEDESISSHNQSCDSPPKKKKRGRKVAMTPNLAAALDRSKVSDRKATFVIAETAKCLGVDISGLALNRSSIRTQRTKYRREIFSKVKEEFKPQVPLVVHWDGKLLSDLTGKEHVDRLPVLVSGQGVSKLLTIAKLASGTGQSQAKAVHAALHDWEITNQVSAMCFDTTSSNTGIYNGACTLLQQLMDKELLWLACRHHIMELLIGAAFEVCMGPSSCPEVLLFKRFKANWGFINVNEYVPGVEDAKIAEIFAELKDDILAFANTQLLQTKMPRDDYREFLELSVIFLGGTPSRGVRFMAPGGMHHARWMSKVLYSLKVWMFRGQFKLTLREEKGLCDFCIFAVHTYLKTWMMAPLATKAPLNDLNLLKAVLKYAEINPSMSKAVTKKLGGQLWYLSEELVALSLFDESVDADMKRRMLIALKEEEGQEEPPKRVTVDFKTVHEKSLLDFVSKHSMRLFQKLKLPEGFLDSDPEDWMNREDFCEALGVVKSLNVVNDYAEHGVALIQEYNCLIMRDEEQLQFLLQVVEQHRHQFPDCSKNRLTASASEGK